MPQISPHFSLEEFTASDTARERGIMNEPAALQHSANLQALALGMEQVRALFGVAITVTSGYRNPTLNAAVGGVPNSAHALGWACDFHVAGKTDLEAAKTIRDSTLVFDQLIYEAGRCVHIAFGPALRRQVLRQLGGPGSPVYDGLE